MHRGSVVLTACALLSACGATPTSVLLTVRGASGLPIPDSVVLSIFDGGGVADRVLFERLYRLSHLPVI